MRIGAARPTVRDRHQAPTGFAADWLAVGHEQHAVDLLEHVAVAQHVDDRIDDLRSGRARGRRIAAATEVRSSGIPSWSIPSRRVAVRGFAAAGWPESASRRKINASLRRIAVPRNTTK
jgi:hypothetical protein